MSLDRGVIDQQLAAIGEGTRWYDRREMRDLPAVLRADERILAISRGKIARVRFIHRPWLIVVTDQRLLCLRSHGGGWRQQDMAGQQITRVSLRVGPLRGRVVVSGSGYRFRLLVPREDAYRLHAALSNISNSARQLHQGFAPTQVVRRVMDHMLALPGVALGPADLAPLPALPPADITALQERIHTLEEEVQELRGQVEFLEQLLKQRHELPTTG